MTTLKITLPTTKAGKLAVFTIKFDIKNFDIVTDLISEIKTIDELLNNKNWEVI